jgi:hypothetical protein
MQALLQQKYVAMIRSERRPKDQSPTIDNEVGNVCCRDMRKLDIQS